MALTNEQKTALIEQRLQQFEADLFQHQLNLAVAADPRVNNTQAVAQSQAAIDQLTAAIEIHQQQLDSIEQQAPADQQG